MGRSTKRHTSNSFKQNPMNININLNIHSPLISNQLGNNSKINPKKKYSHLSKTVDLTNLNKNSFELDRKPTQPESKKHETEVKQQLNVLKRKNNKGQVYVKKLSTKQRKVEYEQQKSSLDKDIDINHEFMLTQQYLNTSKLLHLNEQAPKSNIHKDKNAKSIEKYKRYSKTTELKVHHQQPRQGYKASSNVKSNLFERPNKIKVKQVPDMPKQENFKRKLQKFKIDILKLTHIDENSQVFQSNLHSQNADQQILLVNERKEMIEIEPEILIKIQQMHTYQKQLEQKLQKQPQTEKLQYDYTATKDLIDQYTKFHQEQNQSIVQNKFSLLTSIMVIQQDQESSPEMMPKKRKQSKHIQQLIDYLSANKSCINQETIDKIKQYIIKLQNNNQKLLNQRQVPIIGVALQDNCLNKELNSIRNQGQNLSSKQDLQMIEEWQNKYRRELIKMKKQMWQEYQAICKKNNLSNRAEGNKRIMKCFSQTQIHHCQGFERPFLKEKILNKKQQDQEVQIKLEYLPTVLNDQSNSSDLSSFNGAQLINFQSPNIVLPHEDYWKNNKEKVAIFICEQSPFSYLNESQRQDLFQLVYIGLIQQLSNQSYHKTLLHNLKDHISKHVNKRKGFSTSLSAVKIIGLKFAKFLCEDIYIDQSPLTVRQTLLKNLNTQMGPTDKQLLNSLAYDIFKDELVNTTQEQDYEECQILSIHMFAYFEDNIINTKQLVFERYFQEEEKEQKRILFLRNAVHIYHKAIFDCLNEMLDFQRYFGVWGKPFSWKRSINFDKQIEDQNIERVLFKSIQRLVQNSKCLCGLLADKEESFINNLRAQLIEQMKEERACDQLERFNKELQGKWYFTDDEQAEILVGLSHCAMRILVSEAVQDILKILSY